MNRRAFIQGLIGLASMPMLSKYINVFKPSAVREGITRAADNTMSKGIEFYEAVIKRVMDEGTIVSESDRVRTYRHPDKPDINVELNVGTGDTAVYFETDIGSRAGAEITTDIEMPRAGKELMEHEEIYKTISPEGDYYKDIDEEITGGVGSLEEWIKRKRGYAAGGRVGRWMGGPLSAGKSTLREMLRLMSKGSSHGKSGAEMLKMVNPKQISKYLEDPNLLFMKGSKKEGLMATDMVKDMVRQVEADRAMMIDELLEAAKNIRKADKSIEQYRMEMIEAMMAKGADREMAEQLARMVSGIAEGAAGKRPTPKLTDEGILELETIHKNLLTKGRQLNAAGGRVGMWKGGMPKGLWAAIRSIWNKYGDDAITTANEIKRPKGVVEAEETAQAIKDFNIRNPVNVTETVNIWEDPTKVRAAVDDIFPTGDYKYDAQMAAEALVENNPQAFNNMLYDDLDDATRMDIYGAVLRVVQNDLGKMLQMKRLSKPTKTLEGIEKTGTINISDPNVAEEFARFMKETDPKGAKKVDEIVELMNFDPKGRKKNAKGGHIKDDGDVSLTVIQIPDISQSGVESLFKRR
jgi:hypothetical protein